MSSTSGSAGNRDSGDDLRTASERGGKYLTFFLGAEEYGLGILKVHEIIRLMPITPVPQSASCIKGVINLRGKIIPVVDLRLKLLMSEARESDGTCIIVVQSSGIDVGVIVDKVSEVLDIRTEDIDDAPSLGLDVNTDYIRGIAKADDHVKMLLDIDRVLGGHDLAGIGLAAENEEQPAEALDLAA